MQGQQIAQGIYRHVHLAALAPLGAIVASSLATFRAGLQGATIEYGSRGLLGSSLCRTQQHAQVVYYRLWRKAGLQLPRRKVIKRRAGQPIEGLKRAEYPNHVWTYDFISGRTVRGNKVRILNILDEYTRECLLMLVAPSIASKKVIQALDWLFLTRGIPAHLRSDNGPEFIAYAIQDWLSVRQCQTIYITPGSPWENPFIESFNGKFRAELLDRVLFENGQEAKQVIEQWRIENNQHRPHSSLGYLTSAEFAAQTGAAQHLSASVDPLSL